VKRRHAARGQRGEDKYDPADPDAPRQAVVLDAFDLVEQPAQGGVPKAQADR
jgi:hypothetical protein